MENKSFFRLSDLSRVEIVNVLNEVFEDYVLHLFWTIQTLERDLKENDISLQDSFVLMLGDEPIGIALISFRDVRCRIDIMGIVKKHRRSGYGFEIVDKVIEICRWKGVKKVVLEVPSTDKAALIFYDKVGFKKTRELESLSCRTEQTDSPAFSLEPSDIKLVTNYAHESYGVFDRNLNWVREPSNLSRLSFYNFALLVDSSGKNHGYCIWGEKDKVFYIMDLAPREQTPYSDLLRGILQLVADDHDYVLIPSIPTEDPLAKSARELGFKSVLVQEEMVFSLY